MTGDARLEAFLEAVRASPHNLVSRRALDELETRHLPESIALAAMLPAGPATLVDIGSGGGFPGLVVAVARPDLDVTLIEATGKKARFLEETAAQIGVPVRVVHGRAEEVGDDLRGIFDLATARAVAALDRLVGWAVPLLRPGGRLFAVKGERWAEEVDAASGALAAVRASVEDVREPDAASPGFEPTVVIIRRA